MRDVLDDLYDRWRRGEAVGVGTVVATSASAPRPPGATMVVAADGTTSGSVSGGCVEGAVYDLARQTLDDGIPVLQRYGFSADNVFAIGLTCGGIIDVFVSRLSQADLPEFADLVAAIRADVPVALASVIEHPDPARVGGHRVVWNERASGSLGDPSLDEVVTDDARGMLALGRTSTLRYGPGGQRLGDGIVVFVSTFRPPPRMLVFGAIDFARAAADIASFLGYRVTVCDARAVFATSARFPRADEVVVDWPHRYLAAEVAAGRVDERTAVVVLTHDPKFDVPVLEVALRAKLGYVGAMGSRRTHEDRLARLREAGVTDDELAVLSSPIGLDLGARTPEETAVSIAAEIIAAHRGGDGRRLIDADGPIHH
ncbi:XdhC family protein [Kribbella sp. NPDC051620]|uniref:XdhC family protein n=1 Tax=Kribbella sp. NPDC051620 TaxID=3364120 RepID=UPI00378ADECB